MCEIYKSSFNSKKSGFTIIELSIAIVIIGLVVAGVMAGKEMMDASRQSSLISDIKSYEVAVNTFELNYDAYPGDMRNATDYWGADSAGCPSNVSSSGTCDGNGDGMVGIELRNGNLSTNNEPGRVWQQLSLAKLLKTNYLLSNSFDPDIGVNTPATDYNRTTITYGYYNFWQPYSLYDQVLDRMVKGQKGNVFCTNGDDYGLTDPCSSPDNSAIRAKDGKEIDLKIDDGFANSGRVIASGCIPGGYHFEEMGGGDFDTNYDYDFTVEWSCGLMFFPKNSR